MQKVQATNRSIYYINRISATIVSAEFALFVCIYLYIYMHISRVCVCVCVCVYVYIYMCIYIYIYIYIYVHYVMVVSHKLLAIHFPFPNAYFTRESIVPYSDSIAYPRFSTFIHRDRNHACMRDAHEKT